MNILVINLCLRPDSKKKIVPVGLGYVVSAIHRAGFDVKMLDLDLNRYSDGEIDRILRTEAYDAVAVGCIVTGYRYLKKMADHIKAVREVPIICGNSVASSIPDLLLQKTKVDIAVIGEGDVTAVEVLRALDEGRGLEDVQGIAFRRGDEIIHTPKRPAIADLDAIPFVDWDLFEMDRYLEFHRDYVDEPYPIPYEEIVEMPVNTARGCLFGCTFCYHVFKKDRYRHRSPERICDEIESLQKKYGVNYVNFWDELTFHSRRQCEHFVDTLLARNLGIHWTASCRATLFTDDDYDLARKLKKAGCVGLGYSLESADPKILAAMNKKIRPGDFTTQTRVLQSVGVATWTSLVVGYPEETEESLKATFECCRESHIYPSTGFLLPQPSTAIYQYAVENGYIKDEEEYLLRIGDRQDLTLNMTKLSDDRLQELVNQHLADTAAHLKVHLSGESYLKTGHYPSPLSADQRNVAQAV